MQASAIKAPLRWSALFFSYLFHPLFVGLGMASWLIFADPDFFTGFDSRGRWIVFFIYFFNSVFLPLLVVVLCRLLGFAQSLTLRTSRERIIPYVACIIFFFWTWYVFKNKTGTPLVMAQMSLGTLFAASLSFILNAFYKVSMHGVGVGGAVGLFVALLLATYLTAVFPLVLAIIIAGVVCTSRLLVSDHTPFEIYSGFFVGLICQLAAPVFM